MKKETEAQKTARLKALRLEKERKAHLPPAHPSPVRLYPTYDLDSMLKFGKFAGEIVEDVLESGAGRSWIKWALENIKEFEISEAVKEELLYWEDPRRPSRRDC